ncbi:gluconate 2-dehydrogenase subunit 3 family protein [Paenibacillus tyrfis]|uniref:gluconate 2-dehydrogenase subunit 3 family protein n=1 Tax=Paenibacillus tyrfis TaxID=1501230 RepID=UPI00209F75CE|nr:gluconate 2-dehydrogenase subunit 3 family protein [Paenibacillus tyrfis]MCP1310045.1 gluconate 2-dehydrogenase subunit 3 family protein [Paenibacillus tyrfis]
MKKLTRYPSYDVMHEKDSWDDHTQQIVLSRLHTTGDYVFLMTVEAEHLRAWCSLLVDDERPEIIQFVLDHIDRTLAGGQESQRKSGEPEAAVLVREGLHALDIACQTIHTERFFHLQPKQKKQLMLDVSRNQAVPLEVWQHVPQEALFKKLLNLTVEAYYSHPEIWSEIGYGGPAYPRGYVRMHPGQLDPWEPKEEKKQHEA